MALLTNTNCHANNVNSAAKIFAEYGNFIYAVIHSRVNDEAQADDIFQDFFLFLISKPLPADVRNTKGYLYKAIADDIVDAARRVEKYQTRMHRYARRLEYSAAEDSPEKALIEAEETNKMLELIEKRLPRSEAQAIILRYKNSYNIKEVAKQMDVDKRTISRYISVGLRKVRQLLTVTRWLE